MRKIVIYIMLSLSVFSLSGQTDSLIGFISINDLEELFHTPSAYDAATSPDSAWSYSLAPWPEDLETARFQPYTGLTHIILSLNQIESDKIPSSFQFLQLERLSNLWKGKVYVNLLITEKEMEESSYESLATLLIDLHKKELIDGVNWELMLSQDRTDYTIIEELSKLLSSENISQSYALGRSEKMVKYIAENCTLFIIKAFDFSGRHSTYENAEESMENFIIRRGLSPSQLVLALPTYGRKFHSSDQDYWIKTITYGEIVKTYEPGPFDNEMDSYYFNGIEMAKKKTGLALEKGLAGLALYPLSWDSQGSYSLLETINDRLKQK